MSLGSPAAGDVPGLFDVVINAQGYIFLRTVDQSLPFRTQRAKYTRSPTFVERANTSGKFGDNDQDFFLIGSQDNWNLGHQQRFFREGDPDSERRYYDGAGVKIDVAGQVTLAAALTNYTTAQAISAGGIFDINGVTYGLGGTTNLYKITEAGTITTVAAHGLAGAPYPQAYAYDGSFVYLSDGATVRSVTTLGTAASFSATGATNLIYINNGLYGITSTGLTAYSTAGAATTLFTWKDAKGNTVPPVNVNTTLPPTNFLMQPYGGQIAIASLFGDYHAVWIYDGNATKMVARFPRGFRMWDFCESMGVLFFIGVQDGRTTVYYYASGTMNMLYQNDSFFTKYSGICEWGKGVVFGDGSTSGSTRILYYNMATGGISTLAQNLGSNWSTLSYLSSMSKSILSFPNGVSQVQIASSSTVGSTGYVSSSLFDFDNALTKTFRSVKVDWTATPGDSGGASVDISYQVDALDGSYTSLQVGAASGTEYLLPANTTGRSISIKVTLNKGASTFGPILKRVYVRAAPQRQSYRLTEMILDCTGRYGFTPVILNDNETGHPKTGRAQALNLWNIVGTIVSVTDRFGTYNAYIEPDTTEFIEVAPEEYVVRANVREV